MTVHPVPGVERRLSAAGGGDLSGARVQPNASVGIEKWKRERAEWARNPATCWTDRLGSVRARADCNRRHRDGAWRRVPVVGSPNPIAIWSVASRSPSSASVNRRSRRSDSNREHTGRRRTARRSPARSRSPAGRAGTARRAPPRRRHPRAGRCLFRRFG
jgi:hypothetical protein